MILYIIKWTFIYVILIFLLHNLYLFFQNNLTSTLIKDYYNTYNNIQTNTSKTTKTTMPSNKLQIGSTCLEELNNYSNGLNIYNNELNNYSNGINTYSNELTSDMKSELNDFFNKLKL